MPHIWERLHAKKYLDVDVVTDSTKACRQSLFYGEPTEDKKTAKTASLIQIAKSCCKEEKAFIHLQLFWHLRYRSEIETVLENPGNFAYIAPTYVTEAFVPNDTYCTVVIDGELMYHFLQMVLHLFDMKFVQDLTAMVLEKFMPNEEQHGVYPFVVFFLGKICRRELDREEVEGGDFYLKQFITVLDGFVGHGLISKYEKLCYLFRVAGVVVMKKEDYLANGTDFLELLEEWNFDLSNRIAQETRVYLTEFFEDKPASEGVRVEILIAIEKAIVKLDVSEDEIKEWESIPKTHRITWSGFIGVHAFLAKSVFEKYSSTFDISLIENLVNLVSTWSLKRPKLTLSDFLGETKTFQNFNTVLKRFGEKDRDRKILLAMFPEFSYKDVYCGQTGLRIAEKYLVPGGDYDTVSTYILNALDKEKMPESCLGVPSTVKLLIQKLLCANAEMKARKDELVPRLFKDGANAALILSDYTYHVNNVCSKLGTIEREVRDAAQIAHNRDLVFSTCLEDPVNTVISMMEHAFKSQHLKVLVFAKPFLLLPSSHPSENPPSVRNFCFNKIVVNAGGHDPILISLVECVSKLISNDIMDANDVYEIIKQQVRTLLQAMMHLPKIGKLFQIINSIAIALIELNKEDQYVPNIKEILRLVLNTKMLTYHVMPPCAAKEMLNIRTICSSTAESIIASKLAGPDPFDKLSQYVTAKDPGYILNRNLLQIGYLYVRVPQLQDHITSSFLGQNPAINPLQLKPELEFANIQNTLYTWVADSAVEEWPTLLQFLIEVLPKSPIFEHDIVNVFNRSIPFVWRNCTEVKNQHMFRQYLKFYNKAVQQILLQKGDLSPTREKQLDIVATFVLVVDLMFQNCRKRKTQQEKLAVSTSIQQVMLVTLEVLNVMMGMNPTFEKDMKPNVLDRLSLLPFVKGACEPIRKCMMERVCNYKDAKTTAKKDPAAGDQ
ncbi:uncharacterized protein LOC110856983 [Folsomia candida]|uniref:Uncharacterized protein n=1 Tax=Folsomia candida TaxID=158441 RepID=A0A226DKD4_FOLCA|nr:uncharacterized protein LOC110856983 [Folsomia candida]OXA45693.1 hypothetical protein Fcan01_19711 [Folsomia candida]